MPIFDAIKGRGPDASAGAAIRRGIAAHLDGLPEPR